jgi:hypothetical protein
MLILLHAKHIASNTSSLSVASLSSIKSVALAVRKLAQDLYVSQSQAPYNLNLLILCKRYVVVLKEQIEEIDQQKELF